MLGTTRRILKYRMDKLGIGAPGQDERRSVAGPLVCQPRHAACVNRVHGS